MYIGGVAFKGEVSTRDFQYGQQWKQTQVSYYGGVHIQGRSRDDMNFDFFAFGIKGLYNCPSNRG